MSLLSASSMPDLETNVSGVAYSSAYVGVFHVFVLLLIFYEVEGPTLLQFVDDRIVLQDLEATEVARVVIKEARAWAGYVGVGTAEDPLVIDGIVAVEGGRITKEFVDRFHSSIV